VTDEQFLREWATVEKNVFLTLLKNRAPEADIDDLVQETKVKCWKARNHLRSGSFRSWALRTACNTHIDLVRKHHYSKESSYDAIKDIENLWFQGSKEPLEEMFPQWLDDMPKTYYDALWYELHELSAKEAAELTGCTEANAKTRLYRARMWAQNRIAQERQQDIERGNIPD